MKSVRWMAAIAAVAFTMPAQAGVNDPEVIIYRGSGVFDSDDPGNTGTATSFHCTNFSGVPETIRIVVRHRDATVLANMAFIIFHLNTVTASTHITNIYSDFTLGTGAVFQGTAAIAATSVNITCTAMQIDAASLSPVGIALHMTRFNPVPGTQE